MTGRKVDSFWGGGQEATIFDRRRVIRGGSWNSYGARCRSAFRFGLEPSYGFDVIGFRVVLAPSGP